MDIKLKESPKFKMNLVRMILAYYLRHGFQYLEMSLKVNASLGKASNVNHVETVWHLVA